MKNSAKQGCENMEIKMTTTDTPRTDAIREGDSLLESWKQEWELAISFAKQLERELSHSLANQLKTQAEVERLKVINADMRNFLSKAIHNEGFNEKQALKFIYQ